MNAIWDDEGAVCFSICLLVCFSVLILILHSSHAKLEMWQTQPPSSFSASENGLNFPITFALLAQASVEWMFWI